MPTTYRIEESPNNRAGCQNTECKKEGLKILKGELRFGTWVEVQDNASWKYKHWGCVTPQQFEKWNELSDGNLDLVDGYEELSTDNQDKVAQALKQGHVDDDDWKGDIEKNRPGQKGFRLTQKQKEQREAAEAGDEDASSPAKKPTSKKRARKDVDEDDEDDAKAKKPTKKKQKAVKEEEPDNAVAAPKKASRGTKKAKVEDDADEDIAAPPKKTKRTKTTKAEPAKPAPEKASRRKKTAAAKIVEDDEDEDEVEEEAPRPKAKRGRPKKA